MEGVEQDNDQDDGDDDDGNTYEIQEPAPDPEPVVDTNLKYPDCPPGIALDPSSAHSKISGVPQPEHPVESPWVAPPEN